MKVNDLDFIWNDYYATMTPYKEDERDSFKVTMMYVCNVSILKLL